MYKEGGETVWRGQVVSLVVAVTRVDLPEGEDDLSERRLHRRAPVHDVGAVVEDAVVVAQPDDRRVGRVERRELLASRVEEGERPDLSVLEVHLSSSSVVLLLHLRAVVAVLTLEGGGALGLGPACTERQGRSESSLPRTSLLTRTVPAPTLSASESEP